MEKLNLVFEELSNEELILLSNVELKKHIHEALYNDPLKAVMNPQYIDKCNKVLNGK